MQKKYKIREAFGLNVPDTAMVIGLEPGLPKVPKINPHYVFKEDAVRQMHIFWLSGLQNMLLEGDPSAGKTSLVSQWHAQLGIPLRIVSCSPSTEWSQLVGQLLPRLDGQGLRWHDGPILRACREGSSVLLDEGNLLDPGVASSLNAILDGHAIEIPETGEEIVPAPGTRFFLTQNAVDSKAMVAGRNVQDVAFDDRWSFMRVDYLDETAEKELVVRTLCQGGKLPQPLAEATADIVVKVANAVREAFRADSSVIDKPLSTRAVLRWAKYAVMFQGPMKAKKKSGIHYAIGQAVKMSTEMAKAVEELITTTAGFGPDLP